MAGDTMVDRRILFLAGTHRSGTSMLHRLVRAHPDVSGFAETGVPEDEGQHLQDVVPPASAFGGPGRFAFDPRAAMDEADSLVSPQTSHRLFAQWARHWRTDAPVLIEKSPPNVLRTRFLQAIFPNAAFVLVLRHPVAVACATAKWTRAPLPRLVEHTLACFERLAADAPNLRRMTTVRYEDLIADPVEQLARVFGLVGLAPIPPCEAVLQGFDEHYFERWERAISRPLRGRSLRRAASTLESRARAFGYSLLKPAADLDRTDPA